MRWEALHECSLVFSVNLKMIKTIKSELWNPKDQRNYKETTKDSKECLRSNRKRIISESVWLEGVIPRAPS